jgi:hypothetical protein
MTAPAAVVGGPDGLLGDGELEQFVGSVWPSWT